MRIIVLKNRLKHSSSIPSALSLIITVIFYIIFQGFLHPGYAINDDLKIISIVSGFPAGTPVPFLVFSNVLLGFILKPLYALHTSLNWEMLIFNAINFLSVWALLYIILSGSVQSLYKLLGVTIILSCVEYYALNITFTSTASLACFTGTCLIFTGVKSTTPLNKTHFIFGISLIFIGSLIRIEMLALTLAMTLPATIFLTYSLNIRSLIIVFFLTGMFVFAGYAFDKLYVHANPVWHTYYFYNQTAQKLQDAHRLENLHTEIKFIGWSGNDQELFARSFFPDAGIYSLDRIRYLVDKVSGTSQNIAGSVLNFLNRIFEPTAIPYLFFIAAVWVFFSIWSLPIRSVLALITSLLLCLGENLTLIWGYKDPRYVLIPSLVNVVIFSFVILQVSGIHELKHLHSKSMSWLGRIIKVSFLLVFSLAIGMILSVSITTSQINMDKQNAYQQILADLARLQSDGKIPKNSLIISPAHGLPMEWSNPFILEFPSIPYFDTGWITFSPAYEEVLQTYKILSLPDALYQNNNIYLMTRSNFTIFLTRYYQEHENINISFQSIYSMPNTYNFSGYDDIHIYKVVNNK